MNSTDTLPSVPGDDARHDADELWPTAGPAKGLRVRLPIAIASLAVVALVGAAAGAALKKPASTTAVQAGAVGANRAAGAGANGAAAANGAVGSRLGGPGGGVFGTVTKVDGNTLTVTQRDGTTATVVVPSGTTVSKTVSGSVSDVTAGTSIAVRGTTADGKTTAESITINPTNGAGAFPPGGGFAGAGPQNGSGTASSGTGQ